MKKTTEKTSSGTQSVPAPSTVYLTGQTFDQITKEGQIISPMPDYGENA